MKIVIEQMIEKFWIKFSEAIQSGWGWLVAVMTMVITFISPEKTSFIVVGFAILADLFWGIMVALKLKKSFLSEALRQTLKKVGIYSFALLGALAIETITHDTGSFIAVRTVAVIAAVCEFWSMSASMLIVYPNMPFLKLLRGQLKGEMRSKVSKNVDIDEILKDENKK